MSIKFMDKKYSLILASESPRREELLNYLKIPFLVRPSNVEEKSQKKNPWDRVVDLSRLKAKSVFNHCESEEFFGKFFFPFVVGADTLGAFEGKILGKPKDREEAHKMLKTLAGNRHEIYTGVTFQYLDLSTREVQSYSFYEKTLVQFGQIDDDVLDTYLDSKEYSGKACSYGVQGMAQLFVQSLEGSYSNVVGFPLEKCLNELKGILCDQWERHGQWREMFKGPHGND